MSDNEYTPNVPTKKCTKCGESLPATLEYFYKSTHGKYGVISVCKTCTRAKTNRYRLENSDTIREKKRCYHETNREKIRERSKRWYAENREKAADSGRRRYAANQEKAKERNRLWRSANRDKMNEYNRHYRARYPERLQEGRKRYRLENPDKVREINARWSKANPEKRREAVRRYRVRHPDKVKEREKRYYLANPDKIKNKGRRYRRENPEKIRANIVRYQSRKKSLPANFTAIHWDTALAHFNGCCAYCGAQQDFWHVIEADHWIPLRSPDCPGTVPSNMIPACKSCNSSKGGNEPTIWLNWKFGGVKATQILRRVKAYFDLLD